MKIIKIEVDLDIYDDLDYVGAADYIRGMIRRNRGDKNGFL